MIGEKEILEVSTFDMRLDLHGDNRKRHYLPGTCVVSLDSQGSIALDGSA